MQKRGGKNLNVQKIDIKGLDASQSNLDNELKFNNMSGLEASRLAEKRNRNSFKKLYYLNTKRILQIVGYVPTQVEEKKFLHSNKEQMVEKEVRNEYKSNTYIKG